MGRRRAGRRTRCPPEGKETRRTEWFYEPESFVPLAKRETGGGAEEVRGAGDGSAATNGGAEEVRLWYVVTDHLGTPREMLSEDGSLVWAAEYTTWGSIRRLWQADNDDNPDGNFQGMGPDGTPVYSTRVYGSNGNVALKASDNPDAYACPIRFQGQWADEETGLYYNRFRYYDPDAAQYMSSDPIGLIGGLRSQGYVDTTSGWIDPFGLANCPQFAKEMGIGGSIGRSISQTVGSQAAAEDFLRKTLTRPGQPQMMRNTTCCDYDPRGSQWLPNNKGSDQPGRAGTYHWDKFNPNASKGDHASMGNHLQIHDWGGCVIRVFFP